MDVSRLEGGIALIEGHMRRSGYSKAYVDGIRGRLRRIAREARKWGCWDDAEEWVAGLDGYERRHKMRCALVIARQYDEGLVLPRTEGASRHARTGARDSLCEGLAIILDAYESSDQAARKSATTVRKNLSNAASFLARLEALGRRRAADVTEDDVLDVLTGPDGLPAYSPSHVSHVRAVLRGAGAVDGCERILSYLPSPRRWRKAKAVLDGDDMERVERALLDDSGALSSRDRAIGCLLYYTGMRSCDVAGLPMAALDWDRDVIETVQQKTGVPLRVPLLPQVGNPIFDYVTGERGGSDDPHVFLSTEWPYGGLAAASVYNVANSVLDAAGVRCGDGDGRGCHLFRRTAATAMLGAGADRAVVASVLGHQSAESTDGYMVAGVEGLRSVALDVSQFAGDGGEA